MSEFSDDLALHQRLRFELGTTLQLEFDGIAGRTPAVLVGRSEDEYLIARLGDNSDGIINRLFKGSSLVGRYVHDGNVYGFQSRSLGSIASPSRLLFIAYPLIVAAQSLRSAERIPCLLPATIDLGGDKLVALAMDLSSGGCLFRYRVNPGVDEELKAILPEVETVLSVQLSIPGQADPLEFEGTARSVELDGEHCLIGTQFGELSEETLGTINEFIEQTLSAS
ncbi:MAG: flagellar brake protein [Chromatiales bacterium]|nr:flagellar brake protein [Chromatiales bacterium]